MTGDQAAGDQAAGDQAAGDQAAGDPVAGDQAADDRADDGDRTGDRADDGAAGATDDEAHLAALLAVLAAARADGAREAGPQGTPLQQWRERRLAALDSSTSGPAARSRRL